MSPREWEGFVIDAIESDRLVVLQIARDAVEDALPPGWSYQAARGSVAGLLVDALTSAIEEVRARRADRPERTARAFARRVAGFYDLGRLVAAAGVPS